VFGELDSHQPAATPYGRRHTQPARPGSETVCSRGARNNEPQRRQICPCPVRVHALHVRTTGVSMMRGGAARAS